MVSAASDGYRAGSGRLWLAILQILAQARGPVGQGTLSLLLRRRGIDVSMPTVGRELQKLEFKGLVRKVSVEGRVITAHGVQRLKEWDADARLRVVVDAFLKTLRRADTRVLVDLLAARRIIERETAALAAKHASAREIQRLEKCLAGQAASIRRGDLGVKEDVEFHQAIARASGNPVLASVVAVLRQHHRYNVVVTTIRASMGGRLIEDHQAILRGIKMRRPKAARSAMDRHLGALLEDLRTYLLTGRVVSRRRRAARTRAGETLRAAAAQLRTGSVSRSHVANT